MNLKTLILTFTAAIFALSISSCTDDDDDPANTALPVLLDCSYFNDGANRILTNNPNAPVDYIIDCRAFVNVDVVIEPGVVIEFTAGAGIEVGDNGSLSAIGTEDNPIVLTGETKAPGAWAGVLIESDNVNNALSYVTISYGGGTAFNSNDNKANLIMWAASSVSIDNCTFSNSETYGVELAYNDINLRSFENNVLTANGTAAYVEAPYAHMMKASNDFSGNTNDNVVVACAFIAEGDNTWENINVPFLVTATDFGITRLIIVPNNANLVVDAGTTIIFDTDTGLSVNGGGSLNIAGTANNQVTLTGADGAPGAWRGVEYRFTQSVRNVIEHTLFEYAGGGEWDSAIYLWASPNLMVNNCDFREIDGCVFTSGTGLDFTGFENFSETDNTFINTGSVICE